MSSVSATTTQAYAYAQQQQSNIVDNKQANNNTDDSAPKNLAQQDPLKTSGDRGTKLNVTA